MKEIKRLRVIANLIDNENAIVCDVGADHGLLSKMLVEENRAKKVIATDISNPSLQKTVSLAIKFGLQDKIETRVGDGLKPLADESLDYAVIAGMGGYEIIKILKENSANVTKFILQPVQNVIQLREFLTSNGYFIEKDFVVLDRKKFYNTILCYKSDKKQKLENRDIEFGLTNFDLKHPDFYEFLIEYIKRKEEILKRYVDKVKDREKLVDAKNIVVELYADK